MERRCAGCSARLVQVQAETITADACPSCGGVWFDAGELGALARSRPGTLTSIDELNVTPSFSGPGHGSRNCPACSVPLREFEYPWAPGIRLDACSRCQGIWADAGEITQIEAFVARHQGLAARPVSVAPAVPEPPARPAPPTAETDWQRTMLGRMQAAENFLSRFRR